MARKKKTGEEQRQEKEQAQFEQYQNKMRENDLLGAIDVLDEMLKSTRIHSFLYTLKVDALSQLGRQNEALEAANLALLYPDPSSKLYKLKAELLLSLGQSAEDMQSAKSAIEKAITLYDQEGIQDNIESRFNDVESFKFWFEEKTRSRTEMASLKADITSLLYSINIYNHVQDIQNNLSNEKIKTIELMAIFTAILALIFANVQFTKGFTLMEIVVANGALGIVLTWLLYLIQRIVNNRPVIPRPRVDFGKLFGFFLVIVLGLCVIALVLIATTYVSIIFLRWLGWL